MKLTSLQIPLALWLSLRLWDESWWYLKTLETHCAWLLRKNLSTVLVEVGDWTRESRWIVFPAKDNASGRTEVTSVSRGFSATKAWEETTPNWVPPTGVAVFHSSPFFKATKSDDSEEEILKIPLSSSLQFLSLPEIPKKQFNVFSWS